MDTAHAVGCVIGEEYCCFYTECKTSLLSVWTETLPYPEELLAAKTTLRNGPGKEPPGLCILGTPRKNMQGCSGPTGIIFLNRVTVELMLKSRFSDARFST